MDAQGDQLMSNFVHHSNILFLRQEIVKTLFARICLFADVSDLEAPWLFFVFFAISRMIVVIKKPPPVSPR